MSAATASATGSPGLGSKTFQILQRVGRSLMTPIAVLPAAAILLRLGQADLLGDAASGGATSPWSSATPATRCSPTSR